MNRWLDSAWKLPALGGLLYGTGFYVPLLAPVLIAFVPMLYWLDRQSVEAGYRRLRGGFAFGLAAALIGLHFCFALLAFSWLAALLYVAFALALALRIAACLALTAWLRARTGWSWSLLLPASWLTLDWLQSFGDLRMTGDHVAHALATYPFLIQFADVVGHYGVGAFALLVNALLYEALLLPRPKGRRRAALALAALLLLVLGYDTWAWRRHEPAGETVRVAFVQPNIPLLVKRGAGTEVEQRQRLTALSRRAAQLEPQVIVWPESARPEPLVHWLDEPATYAMPEVSALAGELGVDFLVGVEYAQARTREDYDLYNAAIRVDRTGRLDPTWTAKVYLVPFVEATPFRAILGPLVEGRGGEWRWLAGGFRPGRPGVVLDVGGARTGVLVCYEEFFPELSRALRNAGAEFQIVITNDSWFGRTPFQRFLANAVRLRAIENRTEFVRVANTGISGFIDRRGRFHERTALFREAVAVRDVVRSDGRTVYDRIGDAVAWAALLALSASLWLARSGRSRTPAP